MVEGRLGEVSDPEGHRPEAETGELPDAAIAAAGLGGPVMPRPGVAVQKCDGHEEQPQDGVVVVVRMRAWFIGQ